MIGEKMILAMAGAMMFASAFADTQTVDGVTWTYTIANGEATITSGTSYQRAVDPAPVGSVTIPAELGGCPVTTIGEYAFYYCAEMTAVTFPSSLVNVGAWAFNASGLTSVEIPSGVISIGVYAFYACRQLVSVSIPTTVIDIGNDAFTECDALTEFAIDSSNENFRMQNGLLCNRDGTYVHTCLGGLRGSVTIPAGVTSISGFAFARCPGLTEILVDAGNEAYYSEGGVLYEKATKALIQCPSGKTGIVTISEGVTEIGPEAFDNCKVTKVEIPSSVTHIGWGAFRYSHELKSVCFRGNAPSERVPLDLYAGSPYVTNYVRTGSVGWKSPNSADLPDLWPVDADSDARPIVLWTDEPAIMHSVIFILGEHGTRIGGGELEQTVLGGTTAVAPEVMPQSGWEFRGWSDDIECVSEDMVVRALFSKEGAYDDGDYTMATNGYTWAFTVMGGEATITGCAEAPVGHVVIPYELGGCSVVALGESLFDADYRKDVSGLTGVTIPASVTSIGNYAFWNCTLLKDVVFEGDSNLIEFGADVFAGTLYENGWPVPFLHMDGTVLTGIDWQIMHEDCGCVTNGFLVIPEGTTAIAARACESLAMEKSFLKEPLSVKIPQSVMSIGDYAFAWLENLYDVSLASTNGVSATAFNGTPWKLKTYGWKLPFFTREPPDGSPAAVGTDYVRYETVFEDVPCAVSNGVVNIKGGALAANAFSEACDKKIVRVVCAPDVKTIASRAFSACPYLYQVTLGSATTVIASDAFGGDEEMIDNLSFALDGSIGLLGGWMVFSGESVWASPRETYPLAGNLPFKLGAGYHVVPIVKTVKVGPGLVSEFEIPNCCSIVRATISGVAGAEWTDFTDCEYMGSNRESGEVPFCRCLTYADIVDVEKTAEPDADDNACYYLPQVNMAYWGGWIPKSAFATEDDVADYFRNQPYGFDTLDSIFDWVDRNSAAFGCTESIWDAVSYPDYTNRTAAAFNRFIVENLKDGNALVMLGTSFSEHGITCCGYAADESKTMDDGGYLKGLFIVDSDNDVYVNGGGRNAPNRITYCALDWIPDTCSEEGGDYMIADVWGYDWDYVSCKSALRAMKSAPPKPDGTYEEVVDGVTFNFTVIGGKASLGGGSNKATVVPTSTRGTVKVPATLGGCPVTALGRSAFDDCAGVTEVVLPEGLLEVGSTAFRGCSSLQQAILPASVTKVGTGAFTGCTALKELTLPGGLVSVGNYAFSYCKSVTAVTVPATVTSIGYMAFEGCTGIESVRFNGNVPKGLANSGLLDAATRVFYPRAYESAYAAIVPADKFAGYSDAKGLMLMKAASAGRPVLVDEAWASETLDSRFGKGKVAEFKEKFGRDFAAALFKATGKVAADGQAMTVLDDFIAGTDPTDGDSRLLAKIEIGADGKPKVSWTPDLNEEATKDERVYRVMGAKNLGDGWTEVLPGEEGEFNFFKVEVSMPNN